MKRPLRGIALLLLSILLMLGFGTEPFFDLSFRWSAVFAAMGLAGAVLVFLPNPKE